MMETYKTSASGEVPLAVEACVREVSDRFERASRKTVYALAELDLRAEYHLEKSSSLICWRAGLGCQLNGLE